MTAQNMQFQQETRDQIMQFQEFQQEFRDSIQSLTDQMGQMTTQLTEE